MIKIYFKFCCQSCANRDAYINEHKIMGDNIVYSTETEIGCNHEKVCKEFIESEH